jgi:RNA polymerase sigma-70 factor (ECF subfamily)
MQIQISTEQFNKIYTEYTPRLRGFAKKVLFRECLVEECVQEVFTKLLKQDFSKIDSSTDSNHLQKWLFTVCRNTSFKLKNKEGRYVEENDFDTISDEAGPFENLDNKECAKKMLKALKTLSKQQQKVIKLRYYSDLDYAQIAKKMKTTSGNVGFHLSTGLKNLRKKLLKSI